MEEPILDGEALKRAHSAMMDQLVLYGIKNERVLAAMAKVPRHRFIPAECSDASAYGDHPLPIGYGQTISQPFIVAYMTERIDPKPGEKILEIGTGSGYQAAILAELGAKVFSIEIVPQLAEHAVSALASAGYSVEVLTGDGYKGWPENAPFDAVIITCAPEEIPRALIDQLRDGGRMFLPLGGRWEQRLVMLRKIGDNIEKEEDLPVRFVPMVPSGG